MGWERGEQQLLGLARFPSCKTGQHALLWSLTMDWTQLSYSLHLSMKGGYMTIILLPCVSSASLVFRKKGSIHTTGIQNPQKWPELEDLVPSSRRALLKVHSWSSRNIFCVSTASFISVTRKGLCKGARLPGSKHINNTLQDTVKMDLLRKLCWESLENNQGVKWQVIKEQSMKATMSAKKQQTNKELEHC